MGKDIRDKSLRKWILMFFLGPGLFFLFYLLIVQGTSESPSREISLPEHYHPPGRVVEVDGLEIQAGLANGNIFTRELVIAHNNRVLAEAGKTFFIVPVFSPNYNFQINDFSLLDTSGVQYRPLDIENQHILRAVQQKGVQFSQETTVNYILFKVQDKVKGYYLIMQRKGMEIAWYFEK